MRSMPFFAGLIEQAIGGGNATVQGDGSHFEAQVVSDYFAGQSSLQRHRLVYAALSEHIASGAIHALRIRAYTEEEWARHEESRP